MILWVRLGSVLWLLPAPPPPPPHIVATVPQLRPLKVAACPQEVRCFFAVRCSMLPFGGQKDACI